MRIVVAAKSVNWSLRWFERALFAAAILMLGYCSFALADTWLFQRRESRELSKLLNDRTNAATPPAIGIATGVTASTSPEGLVGRIDVARLGLSVMVVEGTSDRTLRRAAGHIEGTALPGERGNVGISGHRDTLFRPLKNILRNDLVTLTTPGGVFRYRVVSTRVVSPEELSVLDSDGSDVLTLVTCYPFYFVGPAPDRFIVRAERAD